MKVADRAVWAGLLLLSPACPGTHAQAPTVLHATAHGLKADGVTDDGPAIRTLLQQAARAGRPVVLNFPRDKVIAVRTGTGRYVFPLHGLRHPTLEGNGSEFRLAGDLRFIDLWKCDGATVRNLKVDYLDPPTTTGTVLAVDPGAKTIDVQLDHPEYAARLGGPTREDGEQAFFGMLLLDSVHDTTLLRHFYVEQARETGAGQVRLTNNSSDWNELARTVKPGATRIGLPVPGVAHRAGPGALIEIDECRDVLFENVEVWSAPWFAFHLFRNEGTVTLRDTHVRPKPGSGHVLSSCRDAIHAKGNRAELLFENCILTGLGDDAFNLSTHGSRIRNVLSPTQLEISQHFPIQFIPMRAGDTLVVMSSETNEIAAERTITAIGEIPDKRAPRAGGRGAQWAPRLRVTLDEPAPNLEKDMVVWDRQTSNPRSTLNNCTIRRSCRFQTPVHLDRCDIEAFLWFYGAEPEGPGPESVTVTRSSLKANTTGRNGSTALLFSGWEKSKSLPENPPSPASTVLKQVRLLDNRIWGRVDIRKALRVELDGNELFHQGNDPLVLKACGNITATGNSLNGQPLKP